MSKKNKKSTRARLHNFELQKEKEAQELKAKKLQKKESKLSKLKVSMKNGVKVGKKLKFGSKKLSKSEKAAVVKAMEIDG
ncbi:unnamed protein product [Calypogeia fissa]